MHMQQMEAPDIRWLTLASEAHGGHVGEDEHAGPEIAYDEVAFMRLSPKVLPQEAIPFHGTCLDGVSERPTSRI